MHEQRLSMQNSVTSFDENISANVASNWSQDGSNNTRGEFNNGGGRGRGRSGSRKFYCQLCGKLGHFTDRCFHHFDRNFQRPNFTGFVKFSVQTDQKAYLAAICGSTEVSLPETSSVQYSHFSGTPEAYFASPESVSDSLWFVDSGATNHITSNFNNLTLHSQYQGTEKITVGNGKKLPIKHVGKKLPTQAKPISTLSLPNVLHVPAMTKDLINVSKLTKDNNGIVEFHADSRLIRDKETRTVLL